MTTSPQAPAPAATPSSRAGRAAEALAYWGVNLATFGLLAACVLTVCLNTDRGLDLTDESFGILNAAQPQHVSHALYPFGWVTGLLYALAGQSIAIFRLLGVLVLLLAAALLARAASLHCRRRESAAPQGFPIAALVLLVFTGAFQYYGYKWVLAPSYNWLALVAAMAAAAGLLHFTSSHKSGSLAWAFVTGATIAVGFLAKPTTGVLLLLLAWAWIAVHAPNRRGLVFAALCALVPAALLAAFGLAAYGSLPAYWREFRLGLDLFATLGFGHTIGHTIERFFEQIRQVGDLGWIKWFSAAWQAMAVFAAACALLGRGSRLHARVLRTLFPYAVLALLMAGAQIVFFRRAGIAAMYLAVFAIPALHRLCAILLALDRTRRADDPEGPRIRTLLTALLLMGATAVPVFGTGNNILNHAALASLFPALALTILVLAATPPAHRRVVAALCALACCLYLGVNLRHAYRYPYRLDGPVNEQTMPVQLLNPAQTLLVDAERAAYVRELMDAALDAGWTPGTPLLDLTGETPGAAVILSARIAGIAWIPGGYDGSDDFACLVLKSVDQATLDATWVLTEPEGDRSIDPDVLACAGRDLAADYQAVGLVAGQTLHRPKDPY